MTTPCNQRNTRTALTRTGALAVVFGIAFAPTAAYAAEGDPSTIKALIAGDGSVSSVERLPDGAAPSAADIPVKIGISQASEGDVTTTNYHVENTSVQKKTVEYVGADGLPATMEQDVALPLVAQLSVRLPASRSDVTAFGARITKLSDGSSELVWSMVLFSPIGAPITDVSFSAKGKGEPVARLDVAAVQPNSEPGLSATSQAANATVNGNGILGTVGNGASEGLTKLGEGVGKLLEGLKKLEAGAVKLNTGLTSAVDGADQLATGGVAASTGAGALAAGAGKVDAGVGKISAGLGAAEAGSDKLAAGLGQLDAGGKLLSGGLTELNTKAAALGPGSAELAAGSAELLKGLKLIQEGVNALPESIKTNPGYQQLKGALTSVQAAIGVKSDTPIDARTLENGLAKLKAGLSRGDAPKGTAPTAAQSGQLTKDLKAVGLKENVEYLQGLLGCNTPGPVGPTCTKVTRSIPADAVTGPTFTFSVEPEATNNILAGIVAGVGDRAPAANPPTSAETLLNGLRQLQWGLSNPDCDLTDPTGTRTGNTKGPCGVKEIQTLVSGGIDALIRGISTGVSGNLTKAIDGATLVANGQAKVAASAGPLLEGIGKLDAGAKTLSAGLTSANAGAGSLGNGLDQLYTGSQELKAGTGALAAGAGKLGDGVSKIAAGNRKLADGLPAAADGSGAIAEGLGKVIEGETSVGTGIGDVNSKAVSVLQSQFKQGTTLARQQLAGLDAATALAASTPGVQNTTYVLTQSKGDITAKLASADGDDSNMARNLGLAAGGVLLLLGGVAGGFVSGRKASIG